MKFKKANSINSKEKKIVQKVLDTGSLSKFIADPNNALRGGEYVEKFEDDLRKYFKVKHAITVNSWTSGLVAIIGSIGLKQGDEVILSPWTMSACVSSILAWGAIPIFCDIDKETFCINSQLIKSKISRKTKAIMAIDIFGQSSDIKNIKKVIKDKKIVLISDSAQAIGSKYYGKFSGTVSDIGGFSFNYHKHIHTGEGGVIITNNDKLALKCKLIRNHAEITNKFKKKKDIINMIGFNFRMPEIEAAIGIEQLKKLNGIVKKKQSLAYHLKKKLLKLSGLKIPKVNENSTHSYYSFPIIYDNKITGISKKKSSENYLNKKFQLEINMLIF